MVFRVYYFLLEWGLSFGPIYMHRERVCVCVKIVVFVSWNEYELLPHYFLANYLP
jgi:hypothetical protein